MVIGVLGPLSTDAGDSFGRRDRAVLTALTLCLGRAVSADQLADAVWGAAPPRTAHKALQGCILRLRKVLGPDKIETSARGYRLVLPPDDVDFRRFERMVARGRDLLALGEPEHAAYVVEQALGLWRGRAFEDVEDWELALVEAGRLEELRLEAEELRVDAYLRCGRHLDVLADAEGMVRVAPMREQRWALLAVAQYRAGRQVEALRTIQRVKGLLADRLGLDLGPDLAGLEEMILRHDESLVSQDPVVARAECPYRGLAAFEVDDFESFFGRDEDVVACLDLLRTHQSLTVVGPSGSGKSSLVRAGVAATLRREGRAVSVVTPGEHPAAALDAVGEVAPGSVLVVDQCEEAFALCRHEVERAAFFAALEAWAQRGLMVLALRADRLADVAAYPGFARLVERSLYLLGAMSEQGLRVIVEAPARQAGLLVEPGLVDLIVHDVAGAPGALPMLSHALMETWTRREGSTLTVAAYTATGGIRGAVAQSAESVYVGIEPSRRPLLRDLVLRLVTAGAEGEPVCSRVPRRLLSSDPENEHLIDLLVASRLVSSDADVVEIAHEALAREWPRLRGWLDDDLEGQRILHHLTSAADAWESMGRPVSELYRGARLAQALEWRSHHQTSLTDSEVAFLDASVGNERSEQRAAEDRARAQARLIGRLRIALVVAGCLMALALVAGVLAVQQRGSARQQAAAAVAAQTSAEARRAGARALAIDNLDLAMLLAVAGVRLDESAETRSSLLAVLGRYPQLMASTQVDGGDDVNELQVSPDGRTVATYDWANHVRLLDLVAGGQVAEYQAGRSARLAWISGKTRFSPDGRTLAVTGAAPTRWPVRLLDAHTLIPLDAQPGGIDQERWQLLELTYSLDGRRLAATAWQVRSHGDARHVTSTWAFVWNVRDLTTPVLRRRLAGGDVNAGAAWSADGQALYTSQPFSSQAPLVRHDLASGRSTPVKGAVTVEQMALSPDGRFIAASADGGVVLLDPTTGELRRRLQGTDGGAYWLGFSADGSRVGSIAFFDGEAVVWNVASGGLVARLPIGDGGEWLTLSPDGRTAYTIGDGDSLRHWDLEGGRRYLTQVASIPESRIGDIEATVPAPGGRYVAFPATDRVTFLDVKKGVVGDGLDRGKGYRPIHGSGSWHPDGRHFALSTGQDIRVWDAAKGDEVARGRVAPHDISAIDYSTDGSRLVAGDVSGLVTLIDAATLHPVGRPVALDDTVTSVSAGPDDSTAVALTGTVDPSGFEVPSTRDWAILDLDTGTVLRQGPLSVDGRLVTFAPNGRKVAIGDRDGRLLLLDVATGEPLRPPVHGHDGSIASLAYSDGGTRILTSASDGTVALWDARTGLPYAQFKTPVHAPESSFIDDGHGVLIAPEYEEPVFRWNTDIGHAIEFACAIAGRDLTRAEWTEAFGDRAYEPVCAG